MYRYWGSEVYWPSRTQLNQMEMPLIFQFSNFDHDGYRLQTTTTTEFFLARPVVKAPLRGGIIIQDPYFHISKCHKHHKHCFCMILGFRVSLFLDKLFC